MSGVAIITGASSGLGAGLARELGRRGWKVGLIARRKAELRELAEETGGAWAVADVSDQPRVEEAVDRLEEALGPCDLLVANAGIGDFCSVHRWDSARITHLMRVNFDGVVHAFGAVLPDMLERGSGRLAAMSSLAGYRGMPRSYAYSASKAAVSNMIEGMRIELGKGGVQVTAIHPGFVRTPMTEEARVPMPFLMDLEPAARIIADGLEAGRAQINFPWTLATIVRAARFIPDPIWDALMRRSLPGSRGSQPS